MYICLECGKKFKTTRSAEKAVEDGCPGCGGSDIDIFVASRAELRRREFFEKERSREEA